MYKILNAEKLSANVFLMDVEAPRVAKHCLPGQFVIVKMDEVGERIPLTICDYDAEKGTVTIVFQPAGASTTRMAQLKAGDYFEDFVGPLGQPSELCHEDLEELKKKKIVFVAGGVGTAPVYPQVKWLHEHGITADAIVGAKTKDLLILEDKMKEVCNLDPSKKNYAWSFDGVPEENCVLYDFNGIKVASPAINIVFFEPVNLLGNKVHARFGTEFPIRFDFLDTFEGGNLSLQVHPLTEYIQDKFGMHYTQDESYYILDAKEDSVVYLGVKEGINKDDLINDLKESQRTGKKFNDEKYINKFKAKKHDHFLIPAGTIHCSGKNTMVLEISATPYIFTFKLWDWGRLGLDGLPRPVHIEHGEHVIQFDRDTTWVKNNLINRFVEMEDGSTKTGLHEREFIETRRYFFDSKITIKTCDSVNMNNLVEGQAAVIESTNGEFDPFVVHYAETYIIPESIKEYTIRPLNEGEKCGVLKAYVR